MLYTTTLHNYHLINMCNQKGEIKSDENYTCLRNQEKRRSNMVHQFSEVDYDSYIERYGDQWRRYTNAVQVMENEIS